MDGSKIQYPIYEWLFQADPALTVNESAQRSYTANDWPYWSFVENVVDSTQSYPRHYRKVYRRMPTSPTEAEQSDMWTAIYDHTSNTWDGQQNAQDGKTPIIRTSSGLAGKRPRNVWVSAFNYRYARYSQPYEGCRQTARYIGSLRNLWIGVSIIESLMLYTVLNA